MGYLKRLARFWIWLVLVAVGVYVAIANQERINLALPPMIEEVKVPAWIGFLGFFASGAALASLYIGVETFKKSREIRRLTRGESPQSSSRDQVLSSSRPLTIDPHV